MKSLKHVFVGFLISFFGSLPLGYLNIAGLQIYTSSGLWRLSWYLLGVISVEVIVIYFTLVFAETLVKKQKMMRFVDAFSACFMFVLALVFYWSAYHDVATSINTHGLYDAYWIGVCLSGLNFLQLPFWTGWHLYLLNKRHIDIRVRHRYFYVFGTAVGTFCGMLGFVFCLARLAPFFSGYLMHILAAAFAVIGCVQARKYYLKYQK